MTAAADPATVETFARHLARSGREDGQAPWSGQSLAEGAAGIALLHIERARTGAGTWQQAHAWITRAAAREVSAADTTGLYLGAPALSYTLHTAADPTERYQQARRTLDQHIHRLAHRRTAAARTRITAGHVGGFREYDLFYGLTGIGALLLRTAPGSSALEEVLHYLVALTRPLLLQGRRLPGWWVGHDPRNPDHPSSSGGHANLGIAHGICGPLALLSLAQIRGVTVEGQHEAITTVCDWLDSWKQIGPSGAWWPETVTLNDAATGHPHQRGPARPSWCYGTPGITRAGQLAALATRDPCRQHAFEQALADCLADPAQLAQITDTSLCHGWAGLFQTAWRACRDATSPALAAHLPALADALGQRARPGSVQGPGFLTGDAGTALALATAANDTAPTSGWDTCLLIN